MDLVKNDKNITSMKNKKRLLIVFLALCPLFLWAKSFPWKGLDHHEIKIQQISITDDQNRVCKVWGVAGGVDRAIDMALQNAVVSALFFGWEDQQNGVRGFQPILTREDYEINEAYFENFFKKGVFLQFVENVNRNYPTGENNVSTNEGRKVAINVKIDIRSLIDKMDKDNIKAKKIGFY